MSALEVERKKGREKTREEERETKRRTSIQGKEKR
jgi:hypothetical protein